MAKAEEAGRITCATSELRVVCGFLQAPSGCMWVRMRHSSDLQSCSPRNLKLQVGGAGSRANLQAEKMSFLGYVSQMLLVFQCLGKLSGSLWPDPRRSSGGPSRAASTGDSRGWPHKPRREGCCVGRKRSPPTEPSALLPIPHLGPQELPAFSQESLCSPAPSLRSPGPISTHGQSITTSCHSRPTCPALSGASVPTPVPAHSAQGALSLHIQDPPPTPLPPCFRNFHGSHAHSKAHTTWHSLQGSPFLQSSRWGIYPKSKGQGTCRPQRPPPPVGCHLQHGHALPPPQHPPPLSLSDTKSVRLRPRPTESENQQFTALQALHRSLKTEKAVLSGQRGNPYHLGLFPAARSPRQPRMFFSKHRDPCLSENQPR